MKLSRTALKVLSAKYRAVLLKCIIASATFVAITSSATATEPVWKPGESISGDVTISADDKVTVIEPKDDEDEFKITGNLTINDGSIAGEISRTEIGNSAVQIGDLEETGDLLISNGQVSDIKFRMGNDLTITGGSFKSVGFYLEEGVAAISGGTFKSDTRFEGESNLTISGGTFYDYVNIEAKNLTLEGGNLTNVREIEIYVDGDEDEDGVFKINSDKVNKFSGGKEWADVSAKTLYVTEGSSGLLLSKIFTNSKTFKGHITTNTDAYLGSFVDGFSTDYYNGNIIYSVPDGIDAENVTFDKSQLTLNNNSQIGTALISANYDQNGNLTYSKTTRTLTSDEITNSITLLIQQIQNSTASDADVFEDEASGNTEFEINKDNKTIQKLITDGKLDTSKKYFDDECFKSDRYIEEEWDNRTTSTFKEVMEAVLNIGYDQYKTDVSNYNPTVTIKGSTIVMNDDSAIVNYGKDGTINVENSIITANGNNKVIGFEFVDTDGEEGKVTRGTLILKDGNTLYINKSLDANINNTASSTINNFDHLSGTTTNTGTLTLTGASDQNISKIQGAGKLVLGSNTVISKATLDSSSFEQTNVTMNTGSTLDLRNLTADYELSDKLSFSAGNEVDVLLSNATHSISRGTKKVVDSVKLRLTGMDLTGKSDATLTVVTGDLKDNILLGSGLKLDEGYLAKYSSDDGTITFKEGNLSKLAESTSASTALKISGTISENVEFSDGRDKVIKSDGSDMTGTMTVSGTNSSLTLADSNMTGTVQTTGTGAKVVLETAEQSTLNVTGKILLGGTGSQAEIASDDSLFLSGNIEINDESGSSTVKIEANDGLITGAIYSTNKNNTLVFSGNISFSGFFDPASAEIANGFVTRDNYDDEITWTVNQNSTLKYLKDAYLYDSSLHNGTNYKKNSVVLNGGTLDLANGVVSESILRFFFINSRFIFEFRC